MNSGDVRDVVSKLSSLWMLSLLLALEEEDDDFDEEDDDER